MTFTLSQILSLVGKLDDTAGEQTPSKRFRAFLKANITEIATVRDFIEECLRTKDIQYNRALQDLVNYVGEFLGFGVEYGRYQGAQREIGFDGLWTSPTGFHVIVEVKTTEVYHVKISTLVGYINDLISEHRVPSWDNTMGLYVIGRPDPEIKNLVNGIVAEKRTSELRVISSDALVSLAEMMDEFDISHEDILQVLKPSGPSVDVIADLMTRLTALVVSPPPPPPTPEPGLPIDETTAYWLTPVSSDEDGTADDVVKMLVGDDKVYAFGERTPGRKHLKPGDWMAFYATGKGVIAHARVASEPKKGRHPNLRHPEQYPWLFNLSESKLYLNDPIIIDTELRSKLASFKDRNPISPWAWFVQATRKVSEEEFRLLTRS